jgi:hypothetical protein
MQGSAEISEGNGVAVYGDVTENLQVTRETVDAAIALDWLTRNPHNRNLNAAWVAHLAEEMSSGRWEFNGETIIFDSTGSLMDGQHRLQAVFESDASIDLLVVRGVRRESFHTIDTGRIRSTGDVFGIEGYAYAHTLAAAVGWLFRMENGDQANKRRIPHSLLLDYLKAHPDVISSMHFVQSVGVPSRLVPAGVVIALHALFKRIDPGGADDFVSSLLLGSNLDGGSPILRLRERFRAASTVGAPKQQRLHAHERIALAIKVWNAVRTGREMKVLVFRQRGKGAESFPVPV